MAWSIVQGCKKRSELVVQIAKTQFHLTENPGLSAQSLQYQGDGDESRREQGVARLACRRVYFSPVRVDCRGLCSDKLKLCGTHVIHAPTATP